MSRTPSSSVWPSAATPSSPTSGFASPLPKPTPLASPAHRSPSRCAISSSTRPTSTSESIPARHFLPFLPISWTAFSVYSSRAFPGSKMRLNLITNPVPSFRALPSSRPRASTSTSFVKSWRSKQSTPRTSSHRSPLTKASPKSQTLQSRTRRSSSPNKTWSTSHHSSSHSENSTSRVSTISASSTSPRSPLNRVHMSMPASTSTGMFSALCAPTRCSTRSTHATVSSYRCRAKSPISLPQPERTDSICASSTKQTAPAPRGISTAYRTRTTTTSTETLSSSSPPISRRKESPIRLSTNHSKSLTCSEPPSRRLFKFLL